MVRELMAEASGQYNIEATSCPGRAAFQQDTQLHARELHWLETHWEVVQHVAFKIKGLKVMESALKEEVQSLSKAFKKYILYTKLTGRRMVIALAS